MTVELCTRNEVLLIVYGRSSGIDVSGSDIDSAIEDSQDEIYSRYGEMNKAQFNILSARTQYEFRPTRNETYLVKRFFVDSPNINVNNAINRNQIASGSFTTDLDKNTITISTALASSWNGSYGQVDFVPHEWHELCKNKAALNLIDVTAAEMRPGEATATENPRISRIAKRIARIEGNIGPGGAVGSFENMDYDVRDRDSLIQKRFNQNA